MAKPIKSDDVIDVILDWIKDPTNKIVAPRATPRPWNRENIREAHLNDDIGADSLNIGNLSLDLAEKFKIDIEKADRIIERNGEIVGAIAEDFRNEVNASVRRRARVENNGKRNYWQPRNDNLSVGRPDVRSRQPRPALVR